MGVMFRQTQGINRVAYIVLLSDDVMFARNLVATSPAEFVRKFDTAIVSINPL